MKAAIYVCARPALPTYKRDSYDARINVGTEMLRDAARREGIEVGFCGKETAHKHDVVLVSITAQCDWYAYIRERLHWSGSPKYVVVGGAGCLNVRPFRQWWDVAVFGRAEKIIAPLLRALESGREEEHPAVAWQNSFGGPYLLEQATRAYPRSLDVFRVGGRGKENYTEEGLGCRHKCKFCAYTWHRRYISGGAGSYMGGERAEITLLDFAPDFDLSGVPHLRHVGLDGLSVRIRRQVSKPITREMLVAFWVGLDRVSRPHQIKVYSVVGYPGEGRDDYAEHMDDVRRIDRALPAGGKQWSLCLGTSPFRAMPCTPAAGWAMSLRDYRSDGGIRHLPGKGRVYYQGRRLWAVEYSGTPSLPTVAMDALALRGVEADGELVGRLCATPGYWSARTADRLRTLEQNGDMPRWFRSYAPEELPTAYLRSYWQEGGD